MNTAERLAREIWRAAGVRVQLGRRAINPQALFVADQTIDAACRAIGSGDAVAMEAAGQELERITL